MKNQNHAILFLFQLRIQIFDLCHLPVNQAIFIRVFNAIVSMFYPEILRGPGKRRPRFDVEDEKSQLKAIPDGVECFVQIQTSDTSMLGILVFPDQKSADGALEMRTTIMSSTTQKESWFMEGEVKRLQLNNRIY